MDGLTKALCTIASGALAFVSLSALVLDAAFAQAFCDTGNPCARNDTASQSAIGPSTGAGNPIDILTGNKYHSDTDFQLAGELGLSFTRHYNSASVQGGAFGGGWSHTYETALLRVQRDASATITIAQGDGRRIEFEPWGTADGHYQRFISVPFGYGVIEEDLAVVDALRRGTRREHSSVQPWRWKWPDGRVLSFDTRGALRRIQAASGEWLELQYDTHARLARIRDFAGRELRLTYWDRPDEWLAPFDAAATLRGARHRLRSLRLPDGRSIGYGYDANGLLVEARYPDGTRKRYEYTDHADALRLARVVDRSGQVTGTYDYDTSGRAFSSAVGARAFHVERIEPKMRGEIGTSVLSANGVRTSYKWTESAIGLRLLSARGPGCTTCPASNVRYEYDARGLVVRIDQLDAAGGVALSEVMTRDVLGRIVIRERETAAGRELIERYDYASDDPLAQPARIVRPSVAPGRFHVFELLYNDRGQPLELAESGYAPSQGGLSYTPIARKSRFTYYEHSDGAPHLIGRLKSIDGPALGGLDRTRFEYDDRGLLRHIFYASGASERFEYDALGRLVRYVPLDTIPIELEYDDENRVSAYVRAGLRTSVSYDLAGRISKVQDPIGQQLSFEYDAASRLRAIIDGDRNKIELEIDDDGRPIPKRLLNPDGTVSQERSPLSLEPIASARQFFAPSALTFIRLPIFRSWTTSAQALIAPATAAVPLRSHQQVIDERGLTSHYRFDDFGRLVHAFNPDAGLLTLEYDDANRIVARRFADGRTIFYDYDALGRVTTMTADDERVTVEYGAYSKPKRIAYSWGEERFDYDFAGRLIRREQRIDEHRFVRSYRYDDLGRLSEAVLPDGTTLLYRYNALVHAKPGVLSSIVRKGLLTSTPIVSELNNASDRYDRTRSRYGNGLEFERELDMRGRVRRFGTPDVALFELDTDVQGRIMAASGLAQREFAYDGAGRLQRAAFSASTHDVRELALDPAGNARILRAQDQHMMLRIDRHSNRVLSVSAAAGEHKAYRYDAVGRTISIGTRELEYDGFGRLVRVFDNGQPLAHYAYNASGERIRKVVHGPQGRSVSYFFYDGSRLVAEARDDRIVKQYVYVADRLVAMLVGRATYAIHTDWLGTPVAATDAARRIVWRAELDPLGQIRSTRGTLQIDLRGSNQYFDRETGLHYNLHRYFDPATLRYLTPDPIGQLGGLNLYAFANGDPINFVDPLGLQAIPADYDHADRFRVLIQGTMHALPSELRDTIGEALQALLEPATIATAAAIFAAWGLSHLTPFGWAADLLIVGIGVAFLGAAVVQLARGTIEAYRSMDAARTIQELCTAGEQFAATLTRAAFEIAGSGGLAGVTRHAGPRLAEHIRHMFGRGARIPPPGPLLWTQEMPERVTDGFGNSIRQFMAGRNHMWRTQAERGRWRVFEDAAESFVRAYFNPSYVINARHNNGSFNPDGSNGFDVVFVNEQGRLVIGEAKSGRVTPITAFGGGARGEMQLELNLEVLIQRIRADVSIPDHVKDDLIRQVETRTFETQLYISPTSSIPMERLNVFQEMLGRPLDAIYILPENLAARN